MNGPKRTVASMAVPMALFGDIRHLIDSARERAASAVNSEPTLLYWRIGQRIHTQVLAGKRAEYGEEILPTLSAELVPIYGKGFSARNLARMVQFAEAFPEEEIVATLSQQLGWSHAVTNCDSSKGLDRNWSQIVTSSHKYRPGSVHG